MQSDGVHKRDAVFLLRLQRLESAECLGDTLQRPLDIFSGVKGADANVPFAALAEACPRRTNDLGLVQQEVEEFPRITTGVDPDVGSVVSSDAAEAKFSHRGSNECGIGEIEAGHLGNLFLSRIRKDRRGCSLDGI